jgi:recombination protein RecA
MSSVCAQPASGRAAFPGLLQRFSALPKLAGVTPASRLAVRATPEMVSSGIRELDALTGGLPRGCLSEICGPTSSGRTSVLLSALAAATRRQDICALVDTSDAFDPVSAAAADVDFEKLLWIRCAGGHDCPGAETSLTTKGASASAESKPIEHALRVTDLLLQSGGFGLVAIDLSDVPFPLARRIPLASWFRFQRAVEPTPTVLLVIAQVPCAQTCASLLVRLQSSGKKLSAFSSQRSAQNPSHAQLLPGLQVQGELLRSRMERKPVSSVKTAFWTKAIPAA